MKSWVIGVALAQVLGAVVITSAIGFDLPQDLPGPMPLVALVLLGAGVTTLRWTARGVLRWVAVASSGCLLLVLLTASALVSQRSIDACRARIPVMEPVSTTRRFNPVTSMLTCRFTTDDGTSYTDHVELWEML